MMAATLGNKSITMGRNAPAIVLTVDGRELPIVDVQVSKIVRSETDYDEALLIYVDAGDALLPQPPPEVVYDPNYPIWGKFYKGPLSG